MGSAIYFMLAQCTSISLNLDYSDSSLGVGLGWSYGPGVRYCRILLSSSVYFPVDRF